MRRPEVVSVDLLDLLKQMQLVSGDGQEEGLTAEEIAEKIGMSRTWVRARLRDLYCDGCLVVGFKMSTRIDGRPYRTPVYRLRAEAGGEDRGGSSGGEK